MWRTGRILRAPASRPLARHRPYQAALHAIQYNPRGLLAAAEVFQQFKEFYRQDMRRAASSASAGPKPPLRRKPLTQFSGDVADVEPLTILLIKVLCDLRRLEEMRFLFTQCVLELDEQPPSIEVFNVYLLAISMTDTFNQNEVENVVGLMRVRGVQSDIVTKLSLFMLFLRLGQDASTVWWPGIREEINGIVGAGDTSRYPLLGLRLQHCFQILLRLHYDVNVVKQCFDLLRVVSPERLTAPVLLPYMVLSVTNLATPPSTVVDVLQVLESASGDASEASASAEAPLPSGDRGPSSSDTHSNQHHSILGSHSDNNSSAPLTPSPTTTEDRGLPALHNEVTVLRLLAKCAKWGDADSALYVRDYLARHASHAIVAEDNKPVAALLYVEALAQCGRIAEAMDVVEMELPAPYCLPGERPKVFLQSRRIGLLTTDPITDLVEAIAKDGVSGVESALRVLEERQQAALPVTAASLNLVLAACTSLEKPMLAERVLQAFPAFQVTPTAFSFATVLRSYSAELASREGLQRVTTALTEMADAGVAVDAAFVRTALDLALTAQDAGAAVRLAEKHVELKVSIDTKQGMLLLKTLTLMVDVDGIRRTLRAMRATHTPIDPRSLSMCTAVLRKWGIRCDDLKG